MNGKTDWIAVFDSGVGGVSVLRHLVRQMPGERFLYFGDSANAPYGTRPREEIRRLTLAAAEKLFAQGTKALVLACNTATSAAVEELRRIYPERTIVGIEPALKPAAEAFPGGRIGVMATEATLREEKFRHLSAQFAQNCRILPLSAPGLVELVEAGKGDSPEAEALLRPLLEPLQGNLDALVLGCTHYPFAVRPIRRILGPKLLLTDGGAGTARETRRRLEAQGLLQNGTLELRWENSAPDHAHIALCQRLFEEGTME